MAEHRLPLIRERRLFGPMTCRTGPCGADGTVGLDLPGYTIGGEFLRYVRIWLCPRHAAEQIQNERDRLYPRRKRRTKP